MSTFAVMTWAFDLNGITPINKLAAIYFAINAGSGGDGRDPPWMEIVADDLAQWCGCDREEAVTALWELERHGLHAEEFSPWKYLVRLQLDQSPQQRSRGVPEAEPQMTLYVVSTAGGVKIGITGNPRARFTALRAASLDVLEIEFQAAGPRRMIQRAEARCHDDMRQHRIKGEWFDCRPARAVAVARAVLQELGVLAEDQ